MSRVSVDLSATEHAQLGSLRLRKDGTPSAHPYPSRELWPEIRRYLVARSLRANPRLDPELTAYTPGETLALLEHPAVKAWHERYERRDPASADVGDYETVVLVPCAKTKPWDAASVSRSKLYSSYHALIAERPDVCFVTVSEPLGVVPMSRWADFPQYDNPGLFRDDAQQSGMTKAEWEASPFGRWYGLPFDEEAWQKCIARLGTVVADFLKANADRRLIAAVDSREGPKSTHGSMLDVALQESGVAVERYPKRLEARVSPLGYLRDVLAGRAEHRLDDLGALSDGERGRDERPRLGALAAAPKPAAASRPAPTALTGAEL